MFPEVTSVYVPVKTPDYKTWAILLSLLLHGLLVGTLLYFQQAAPPAPMETSLVTPEQLAAIESQIRANQQTSANNDSSAMAATNSAMMPDELRINSSHSSHTRQALNDISAKEAAWRKDQALFAKKIDQEMAAQNQQVIQSVNEQQDDTQQTLNNLKISESSNDETLDNLRKEAAAAKLATSKRQTSATNNAGQMLDLATDGHGSSNNARAGAASGGDVASYKSQIVGIIYNNWDPPANSNQSLVADFSISPSGAISNIRVNGGDDAFKRSLVQAIQRSSPLPPPPAAVYSHFSDNHFTFRAK